MSFSSISGTGPGASFGSGVSIVVGDGVFVNGKRVRPNEKEEKEEHYVSVDSKQNVTINGKAVEAGVIKLTLFVEVDDETYEADNFPIVIQTSDAHIKTNKDVVVQSEEKEIKKLTCETVNGNVVVNADTVASANVKTVNGAVTVKGKCENFKASSVNGSVNKF